MEVEPKLVDSKPYYEHHHLVSSPRCKNESIIMVYACSDQTVKDAADMVLKSA